METPLVKYTQAHTCVGNLVNPIPSSSLGILAGQGLVRHLPLAPGLQNLSCMFTDASPAPL